MLHQLRLELWGLTLTRYLNEELFSYQWWGIVALLLVSYTIWWRLVDRTRLAEILLYGSFVAVTAAVIDIAGVTAALWQYNYRLFPILPAPFPFDYTVLPILAMLAYQYSRTWGKYVVLSALGAAVFSFVVLPLFQTAGIITLFNWSFGRVFWLRLGFILVDRAAIRLVLAVMAESREKPRTAAAPARGEEAFALRLPRVGWRRDKLK